MKRILIIFCCLLALLGTTGCTSKKTNNNDTNAKKSLNVEKIFFEVIEGKRDYYDETNQVKKFLEYLNTYRQNNDISLIYTLINMDNLDEDEMIISLNSKESYLIFHYEEGIVYGYEVNFREMKRLNKDGTYNTSESAGYSTIETAKFNKNEKTSNILASYNYGKYTINDNEVSMEEYKNYENEFNNKEEVEFITYKTYEKIENNELNTNNNLKVGKYTLEYGNYYVQLTDGTIATDNSGTITINSDSSCSYIEGWADMGCSSYYISDDSICLKTNTEQYCFPVSSNNQIGNIIGNTFIYSK